MTTKEAVNWIINVRADIGKIEHQELWHYEQALSEIMDVLENAVPVVHGRWIKKRYWSEGIGMGERYGYWYACSKCDHEVKGGYDSCGDRFCSECGALMDGKDGDS